MYKSDNSCYNTHKPLKVGERVVQGGSCIYPPQKGIDVYIGLDRGMNPLKQSTPWEGNLVQSYSLFIPDMGVPADTKTFIKMIDWMALIPKEKRIHVGCIGGHGRTGMVLSALVSVAIGEVDAISYVRDNYCIKAVESQSQVEYLYKVFGIKKVNSSKCNYSPKVISYPSGLKSDNGFLQVQPTKAAPVPAQKKKKKDCIDFLEIKNPIW